ncbi:MAG: peptidoglycan-binding protein [Timaviella obliquedivisa GSE-PSE-MK23-08B]|nr:peptidoglycan-binding protein [Timaviella obliquedivisa GSE-PSE-MK23-08B]
MPTIQCPAVRPTVQSNASGRIVSEMQTALNARLKEIDVISRSPLQVAITGSFEDHTRTAVQYLQCLAFLKVDGIVGAKTWAYLCEGTASMPVLRKGAFDALVGKVQQALKDGDFYKGAVDNDFGAKTETAVKAFQAARVGLKVDGVIGAKTWTELSRFDAHSKSCFVDNLTL